jgi:hypothetical protein
LEESVDSECDTGCASEFLHFQTCVHLCFLTPRRCNRQVSGSNPDCDPSPR